MQKIIMKYIYLTAVLLFSFSSLASADQSQETVVDKLLDILEAKGIITESQHKDLKNELEVEKDTMKEQQQVVQKVKSREEKLPRVGYKNGFYLETPDEKFKLKLSGRFHADFKGYESSHPGDSTFLVRRARLAMSGTVYKYFDFKVESEFGKGTSGRLNDGYVNVRYFPQAQVKIGQYKQPYGFEEMTSDNYMDFIERSIANKIVPSRDVGLMLHGNLFKGILNYGISVANGYKINQSQDTDDHKDVIGRLVLSPFITMDNRFLKGLHIGGSVTYGEQESDKDDWWNSGEYKTAPGTTYLEFDDRVTQDGKRRRYGTELAWFLGPFSVKGEWMGLRMDDLWLGKKKTSFTADAGYIALSYFITGEEQPYKNGALGRVKLKNDFDPEKRTWGAWQIVARYGFFDADSDIFRKGFVDRRRYTDRAEVYTVGVNLYLNDMVRLMLNYVRTDFDKDILYRETYIDNEDVILGRFQLAW